MLTRTFNDLPFEYLASGAFEKLCLALVRRTVDEQAEHLGAAGSDEGYDVRARVDGKVVCYQCKRYQTFQLSHAKRAIDDAFASKEPPDQIVLVVSRNVSLDIRRDAEKHSKVPCSFWARSELEDRLWQHRDIIERFFGPVRPPEVVPPWNVLRRNPYFTGRREAIQSLRQALVQDGRATLGQAQALTGLGGIGKTQTAIEYANAFHLYYTSAFWLAAETEATLRASIVAIAKDLEPPEVEEADEDRLVEVVLRRLSKLEGGLLVYDNVEDPELLKRYLPQPQRGHVVITSRLRSLRQHHFRLLEMPVFSRDEAVAFLFERTGRTCEPGSDIEHAASDLAEELGCLPLALEQAAAYIDSLGVGFDDYLTTYRRDGLALLEEHGAIDHPDSVAVTWAMNIEQVERENPHALHLFRILAFLAPDDVPEEIFEHTEVLGSELAEELSGGPLALAKVLEPLRRFSLIDRDASKRSLSVHRLVQSMTRLSMSEEVQKEILWQVVHLIFQTFPEPESLESWEICERLMPHLSFVFLYLNKDPVPIVAAPLLHRSGAYCYHRARYVEAESLYLRSLHITEMAQGAGHLSVAQLLNNLAVLYRDQGRYEQLEPLYLRSLRIKEAVLGAEDIEIAQTLNNLAMLYRDQGRFADAEHLVLRSLGILESTLGAEHLLVAKTLNNLATLYSDQGRSEKLESLYLRSLRIIEAALGAEHPSVANALNNLAGLYSNQKRSAEAEALVLRSLRITEATLGAEHPSVAQMLNNLASLYRDQGRFAEAESLFLRVLAILKRAFDIHHPFMTKATRNYEVLLRKQGRDAEADQLLKDFEEALTAAVS